MTFAELNVHPSLARAIAERGYEQPTPVQQAVLEPSLAGADLIVSSETGSGKTIAFGLAFAPTLLGEAERFGPTKKPLALIVAPTRELALQVQRELQWLYGPAGARIAALVGGMPMGGQLGALKEGAHVVVGTPGRLVDHLERRSLSLELVRAVVLDEADEMLDMGFRDELERVLRDAPKERRTLLFSATVPPDIEQLAERYQRDARRVAATPPKQAHRDIEYRAHLIALREREHAIVNVLRQVDAPTIVFCSTREAVNHLHANLVERGFPAVAISGELTQPERLRALKALRDGRARVLVATDVAARGLDLPDVGLVVHADLPNDPQVLQHRSGRTGRAGKKGVSVMLVPVSRRRAAERLIREAHVSPAWAPVPAADAIRELDRERIVKTLMAQSAETTEEDRAIARRLLEERGAEELAAMLVSIERAKMPEPEELPETTNVSAAEKARPKGAPREFQRPAGVGTAGEAAWFSINVGRSQKADPKWLIPLLCRRGRITKAEIGAIRILAEETRVEIAPQVAERFGKTASRPDPKEPRIRISPSGPPAPRDRTPTPGPKRERPNPLLGRARRDDRG